MGILDDAKDKLGDAAEWVKDKAQDLGEHAHDAGQTLGEKAAEAKNWVEGQIGSGAADAGSDAPAAGSEAPSTGSGAPEARAAGGGDFTTEWVEATPEEREQPGTPPSV
ncbi:hypothetical protein [Agrococcus beijingensis]|uniref:hypothetical protein n=1 Tax=Agrococcus beijingensis TaxID=3068634 RepID=UPI00274223FB|nr:hypothetical protein [Agrococcus sp. REN33]